MTTSPPTGTRLCVCPGSYDPVTNGHLDVIARSADLFDEVVVVILYNPNKASGLFTAPERRDLVLTALADVAGGERVRVELFANMLLVDACRQLGATAIVKGLRSGTDFAYELPMAHMNRHLTGIETIFLPGNPAYEHVSSSLIKEVVRFGGDVTGMVPDHVLAAMHDRIARDFGQGPAVR